MSVTAKDCLAIAETHARQARRKESREREHHANIARLYLDIALAKIKIEKEYTHEIERGYTHDQEE